MRSMRVRCGPCELQVGVQAAVQAPLQARQRYADADNGPEFRVHGLSPCSLIEIIHCYSALTLCREGSRAFELCRCVGDRISGGFSFCRISVVCDRILGKEQRDP